MDYREASSGPAATTIAASDLIFGERGLRAVIISDGAGNPFYSRQDEQFSAHVIKRDWGNPDASLNLVVNDRPDPDGNGSGNVKATGSGFDITLPESHGGHEFSVRLAQSGILEALFKQYASKLSVREYPSH